MDRQNFDVSAALDEAEARFTAANVNSARAYEDAQKSMPGGRWAGPRMPKFQNSEMSISSCKISKSSNLEISNCQITKFQNFRTLINFLGVNIFS